LIEVRLPTGKPGRAGGEQLKAYCQNPAPDVLLLITSSKLERGGKTSAWFKAIDKVGVTIEAFPVAARDLPRWIAARCQQHGLSADKAALELISERVEGNLLAAAQEVERLALLHPNAKLATRAAEAIDQRVPEAKALKDAGVWASRVAPLKIALKRHSVASWLHMLQQTADIDRMVKGQEPGDVWDAFTALSAGLAGHGNAILTINCVYRWLGSKPA